MQTTVYHNLNRPAECEPHYAKFEPAHSEIFVSKTKPVQTTVCQHLNRPTVQFCFAKKNRANHIMLNLNRPIMKFWFRKKNSCKLQYVSNLNRPIVKFLFSETNPRKPQYAKFEPAHNKILISQKTRANYSMFQI